MFKFFFALFLALAVAQKCKETGCSKKYGSNYCCSYYGYCGTTAAYCGTGSAQCVCDCKGSKACSTTTTTTTTTTSSANSVVQTGGVAQNSFGTTGKESKIRASGCYFLCYCKLAGLTTKAQVLTAYDACLSKGYIRDTCYINSHANLKSYFKLGSIHFVHVKSSSSSGHWLIKLSDTQFWDPWDAKVYAKSKYTVLEYRNY